MLTLFTWGYWGWGNSTRKLVEAVDAVEKQRGFTAPVFIDIRISRSVRALGFSGSAFKDILGAARYKWMPELGNRNVRLNRDGIRIDKPQAAQCLLESALESQRQKRRVLFFCSCPEVKHCHRNKVADLVLKQAARRHRRIEIVEWPGNKPPSKRVVVTVSLAILNAVIRGRKTVPLPKSVEIAQFAGLPWGSVAMLKAGSRAVPVVSGPAMYHGCWCLPVFRVGKVGSTENSLRSWAANFRKTHRLEPRGN